MKISEIMTSDVEVVTPEQPIQEAARLMLQVDAGVMPVRRATGWSAWSPTATSPFAAWRRGVGQTLPCAT